MKLIFSCPICHKKSNLKSESTLGDKKFILLDCNHCYTEKALSTNEIDPTLNDGRLLYDFQKVGVEFARNSDFRCLIADEMGLGKTIQVVSALKNYREDLLPALVIVKASLKIQWMRELFNGAGILSQILESKTHPITDPRFTCYITTYDSLRNATWKEKIIYKSVILDECQQIKNHDSKRTQSVRDIIAKRFEVPERILTAAEKTTKHKRFEVIATDLMSYHGISGRFIFQIASLSSKILGKTKCNVTKDGIIIGRILLSKTHIERDNEKDVIETILHEIAHAITPGAGHRPIWQATSLAIGGDNGSSFIWCNGSIEDKLESEPIKYVIATSGTPIKNHAGEYFPILNILRPEIFREQSEFIQRHTNSYRGGYGWKVGGLRSPTAFKELTKDFIIRRSRKEVLPDLPIIRRSYRYTSMNEVVGKQYQKEANNLTDYLLNADESSEGHSEHILALMNKLRHLTGFAKIESVFSYVEEFLENEEDQKLTIFHHHIDVADILAIKFKENQDLKVFQLKSTMNAEDRTYIIDAFKDHRGTSILLVPTLACGEGINLQFCSHAIIMEREWNPSNEEQAEGRFSRIGSTADSIEVIYPVAIGSIDELFAEYVERKRQYISEAMEGSITGISWNQSQIIKDITNKLMTGGYKPFKLV